jgi:hypothetical protein
MLERKLLSMVGALVLVSALAARAGAAPIVEFYVDGALQTTYTCADPEFDCTNPSEIGFFAFEQDSEWDISISAAFYPDSTIEPNPQIIYSSAVTDRNVANTFGFVFLHDVAPVLGSALHENSSSSTDSGIDGVAVSPIAPLAGIPLDTDGIAEIAVYTLSIDGGATYLSAGLDLRAAFVGGPGPNSDTQTDLSEGGPGPGGAYNQMRVDVNFSLPGGDDSYTSGGKALIVVPEPMSFGLVGLGLLALGVARRRRS